MNTLPCGSDKNPISKLKLSISDPEHLFHFSVWLLTGILFFPVFYQLYHTRWDSIDYTHAYFILPVAFFLGWHALKSQNFQKPHTENSRKQHALFAALLVLGLISFQFGWRQDYLSLATFSALPILLGLVGFLYGSPMARVLWFPIAYLLLLVPPPLGILDSVTLPMRLNVSITTEHLLAPLGFPITRDGLTLQIGSHHVFLGEACSGFRSMITLLSLSLASIFISKASRVRKWIMIAAIIPLALLGNLIRVMSVVIVTFYLGETRGQKFFHDASGLVMFVILITGLLLIENVKFKTKNTETHRLG